MSVLVFGSLNSDLVAYADQLPSHGQTVTGERLLRFPGGKGLNQAIAARRSGAKVLMAGAIGDDGEGEYLKKILVNEGIDPRIINQVQEQTGIAVIEVAKDAQNRILIIPGANAKVIFEPRFLTEPTPPKLSLAQLETPINEVEKFLVEAKAAGAITILNPAPIQKLNPKITQACDYLVVNETESSFLVAKAVERLSKEQASEIGKKLLNEGFSKVVITLADKGSIYVDPLTQIYTPAYKVNAIDTTAAGDAFCGALVTALCENQPIESALKFASAAGAVSATKNGAVPSIPKVNEILSMLESVQ